MSEEFDDSQDMVSDAFVNFMHMRSELSEFVEFYHILAREAVTIDDNNYKEGLYDKYRSQSIFFLENYLLRLSDMSDIYIEDLLIEIAAANRNIFIERELVSAKNRLEKMSAIVDDEYINVEASYRLSKLSKPEIFDLVRDRVGFDIQTEVANWVYIPLIGQIRNVIVHNRSYIDEKFLKIVHDLGFEFGGEVGDPLLLSEKVIMDIAGCVDDCICEIDAKISRHVQIHKRNRCGHFWLPRSQWGTEELSKQTETLQRR